MLDLVGRPFTNCDGISRRGFLKTGVLGLGGLTLADVLKARALGDSVNPPKDERSVILIWLDGGPPQHETYDPKPDAPVEYRGPIGSMPTKFPGTRISELLPKHARLMDKISLIRSMHHTTGDHFAAAHWMLTGYFGATSVNLPIQNPSFGSVIAKLKGPRKAGMPAYVGLPNTHSVGLAPGYHGAAYLGVAYNPFNADGDPNGPGYSVPNLSLPAGLAEARLSDRQGLLNAFDTARRDVDSSGLMDGLDDFRRQAYEMISGPAARAAFDLSKEDPRLRDEYGRHRWGQSALLGRRLVEAGVRFVTLTFDGWDWHSSIERGMKTVLPVIDAAIATLIDDLDQRGLLDTTMVIVMGEFGRGPRINKGLPNDPIPGRDHWGDLMSVLITGGGLNKGMVVGSSNSKGEVPRDRPVSPEDLLVTVYNQLGINPNTAFHNRAGRPSTIGSTGSVISELVART